MWTRAAPLEDLTLGAVPKSCNNLCMLKKHNELEMTTFLPESFSSPGEHSGNSSPIFVLIIYFRRFRSIRELHRQESPLEAWTSVKHGPWRKEPGCLMLEFITLPTPEGVWLLLMSLIHVVLFNSCMHCVNPAMLSTCPMLFVFSKEARWRGEEWTLESGRSWFRS